MQLVGGEGVGQNMTLYYMGEGVGQNMIFNDMGWRPDMIWYITALVALLAGIDGEPIHEDLNSLFRPSIVTHFLHL